MTEWATARWIMGRCTPGDVGLVTFPVGQELLKDVTSRRDRYGCDQCGAELVYEKPCPCPPDMPHVEICCGQQMKKMKK
jgi:hypothetical protein